MSKPVGMSLNQPVYGPFQGVWSGRAGLFTVELDIDATGAFRWTSTFSNARAEGQDLITKSGYNYLIVLPFIQQQPLSMHLGRDKKSLTLIGESGIILHLSRVPPTR
ncbi:MAG: hypothetical protein ACREF3_03585 [Acetobacteraceae bacterium]